MQIFKDPNSNRFNIRSQFCPTVPSFEIVFSPLVFRLFNYSCYFYISLLEFDAQFEIFDGKATCKRTEQLSTLLGQQCWELLGPCWQWCALMHATTPKNGGTFTVHRGKDKSHLKTWETMCNPNNVGRAVQTNPTLLRYPSVIKKHVRVQILRESRYKGSWVEQRFNYFWASWFF